MRDDGRPEPDFEIFRRLRPEEIACAEEIAETMRDMILEWAGNIAGNAARSDTSEPGIIFLEGWVQDPDG
jgi:hypothetical protein